MRECLEFHVTWPSHRRQIWIFSKIYGIFHGIWVVPYLPDLAADDWKQQKEFRNSGKNTLFETIQQAKTIAAHKARWCRRNQVCLHQCHMQRTKHWLRALLKLNKENEQCQRYCYRELDLLTCCCTVKPLFSFHHRIHSNNVEGIGSSILISIHRIQFFCTNWNSFRYWWNFFFFWVFPIFCSCVECRRFNDTYHFVKHPIQQGIRNSEYRVEAVEFHYRLIQVCGVDADERSSENGDKTND